MWGSARDVFETILPSLYVSRAERLRTLARDKPASSAPGGGSRLPPSTPPASSATSASAPYEADDVDRALASIAASRHQVAEAQASAQSVLAPAPDLRPERIDGVDAAPQKLKNKPNVRHKIRRIDEEDEQDDEEPEPDVWAALEVACQELGYDADFIVDFLEHGSYPQELLDKIAGITSCEDQGKIREVLDGQKGGLLSRMKQLIQVRLKEKSEEEARCQQKLQMMGRCPMDFEWLREEGGWRCAGGSHWVSDADIEQFTL